MYSGIHITGIVQPESGGIIATYCERCRATTFSWGAWYIKPEKGDFFLVNGICGNPEHIVEFMTVQIPQMGGAILPGNYINPFPTSGSLKNEQGWRNSHG